MASFSIICYHFFTSSILSILRKSLSHCQTKIKNINLSAAKKIFIKNDKMEILLRFVPTNSLRLTASRLLLTHVANYTRYLTFFDVFFIFCINYVLNLRFFLLFSRLAEVGKLEAPKSSGKYETGQLILHKVFGYRGVILFPWLARVYDRDATNKKETTESSGSTDTSKDNLSNVGKEVKGRTHTFYQVLIDTRDAPYIVSLSSFILPLFTSFLVQ